MLEIANLHVRFGRREVLHGVNLSVRQGEIVTLVGSNGAGKTTLLKTISGLVRPSDGSIMFDGERIDRMQPHAIIARGLAQIPEGRLLFPQMTVLEHLELGGLRAANRAAPTAAARPGVRAVSDPGRAAPSEGRHAERRTAADGRDRPRPDGGAALPHAR